LIWSQAAIGRAGALEAAAGGPSSGGSASGGIVSGGAASGGGLAATAVRPAVATAPSPATMCEEDFTALYRQLAAPLAAYARRTLGSAEEAHDVVQETFYRYLRAELPAGTDPEVARPYLYRTASHLMRDRWRRGKRELRWREAHPEPRPEPPRDRTLASDLDRALGRLKPRDRALLWLAHVEGASHREIAAALAIGEASVRVLLFRARKRFEAVLAEHGFTQEEG